MERREGEFTFDLVIPCYEEEAILSQSVARLRAFLTENIERSGLQVKGIRILLIDDGSKDGTWPIIEGLARAHAEIVGIKLSRNFGHQNALVAGLEFVEADVSISLDADLQDDISVIVDMLKAYTAGHDLALGVRTDRASDTFFKRQTAHVYYRLLGFMGLSVVPHHADFRLMSRAALQALLTHREVNLYLRGLVPTLGFSVVLIPYSRQARSAGTTKYTLSKMMRLALDGITSFSITPLRLVSLTGFMMFFVSFALGCYVLTIRLFFSYDAVPGWASTLLPLVFLGGIQILSIGVMGEYIGKIYLEVKQRPRFIVERTTSTADLRR